MAVTLVAFGLAGCPGRMEDNDVVTPTDVRPNEAGGDVQDVTPADAADAQDVPAPMDAQDVQPMMMDVQDVQPDRVGDVPGDSPGDVQVDVQVDAPVDATADAGDASTPDPTPTMVRKIVDCNGVCRKPTDAVLNSTGTTAYFTAFDPTIGTAGTAAVFSVPVAGGTITRIAGGPPLSYPVSIAISNDDATLYIADMAADRTPTDTGVNGAIFSLGTAGGMFTRIAAGNVVGPSGIAVDGTNLIVSGRVRMGAVLTEAVFSLPVGGGTTATVLAMDSTMLNDPTDVSVAPGASYRIVGTGRGVATGRYETVTTTVNPLYNGFVAAWPAGIASSRDGMHVLISGWAPGVTSRLLWLNADGTGPMTPPSTGMSSPTGIGRARSAPNYVVADENAGVMGNGAIFEVR
jgi:hypothetical protein